MSNVPTGYVPRTEKVHPGPIEMLDNLTVEGCQHKHIETRYLDHNEYEIVCRNCQKVVERGTDEPVDYMSTTSITMTEPSALAHQEGGDHYKKLKIQPIEYIHANGIPFAEGSVIKYVSRWRDKGGIKDLEKARHFLDLLIELESTK